MSVIPRDARDPNRHDTSPLASACNGSIACSWLIACFCLSSMKVEHRCSVLIACNMIQHVAGGLLIFRSSYLCLQVVLHLTFVLPAAGTPQKSDKVCLCHTSPTSMTGIPGQRFAAISRK